MLQLALRIIQTQTKLEEIHIKLEEEIRDSVSFTEEILISSQVKISGHHSIWIPEVGHSQLIPFTLFHFV